MDFVDFSLSILYFVLHQLIQLIQPFLVPICFVAAWGFVGLGVLNLWTTLRDGVTHAQRIHRIPCSECKFFTGDYHLKCTVHPQIALSEDAIDCVDYAP